MARDGDQASVPNDTQPTTKPEEDNPPSSFADLAKSCTHDDFQVV